MVTAVSAATATISQLALRTRETPRSGFVEGLMAGTALQSPCRRFAASPGQSTLLAARGSGRLSPEPALPTTIRDQLRFRQPRSWVGTTGAPLRGPDALRLPRSRGRTSSGGR